MTILSKFDIFACVMVVLAFWSYRSHDGKEKSGMSVYFKFFSYGLLVFLILSNFLLQFLSAVLKGLRLDLTDVLTYDNNVILAFTCSVACLEMIDNYYEFKSKLLPSQKLSDLLHQIVWTILGRPLP